jgi:hypothetical protein
MARGETELQISQANGKYDEWASQRLRNCLKKLGAATLAEGILKLVAIGYLSVEIMPENRHDLPPRPRE